MFRRWRRRPPEPPVIDEGYLARLARHVGEGALSELLADGLIEIEDRVRALELAAAAGDREGALRIGHDLAGIAGHLGLARLSWRAAEMMRAARAAPDAPAAGLAGPVAAAGREACVELAGRRVCA
ncbi:MAG: Hpt domain-containing protein [Paracoccaceae bacterium]